MKLYELGTGEPVQVLVKVENASAEYDSTVAFGKEGILLIEPIRYDGKIINFSGDKECRPSRREKKNIMQLYASVME
mgnify:CR=1 FL=1